MTREEKIAELINIRDNFNYTLAPREVFDDAIKALEQEPVLDKIRAEIKKLPTYDKTYQGIITAYGIKQDVLEIIDKYKAESEET